MTNGRICCFSEDYFFLAGWLTGLFSRIQKDNTSTSFPKPFCMAEQMPHLYGLYVSDLFGIFVDDGIHSVNNYDSRYIEACFHMHYPITRLMRLMIPISLPILASMWLRFLTEEHHSRIAIPSHNSRRSTTASTRLRKSVDAGSITTSFIWCRLISTKFVFSCRSNARRLIMLVWILMRALCAIVIVFNISILLEL